jgi:protein-disulfide isomerase
MKKLLIATLLILMFVPAALAESVNYQTGLHQAKMNVNVRALPKASSTRINHFHKGDTVNVKRVVGGWCDVELKKYKHAYVNCSLLEAVSGTPVSAEQGNLGAYADYNGVKVSRNSTGNWTLGSADAKVVMEEFGDMQCPFCGNYFIDTFPKIFSNYITTGKVKYVFYNFPLSFHLWARTAAMASLCAGEQDKYWQMHALILENQSDWRGETVDSGAFDGYAKSLGLKMGDFGTCMEKERFGDQIAVDLAVASKREVSGTPTFFINGTALLGSQPYEVFSDAIETALNK